MKHHLPSARAARVGALAKAIFFLSLWMRALACVAQEPPCGGDTVDRCWTGAVSGLWSNPNNWTPVGVPQNGELLRFHNDHNISMVNDLPNLTVKALWFFDFDYVLTGNPITFAGVGAPLAYFSGIVNFGGDDSHLTTINCPIILGADAAFESGNGVGGPIRLDLNGEINLNGHTLHLRSDPDDGRIEVSSVISGNGDVVVEAESPSTIEFNGQGNTFRGTLQVVSGRGFISFNKASGVVVNDALLIRGLSDLAVVRLSRPEQIGDGATVTLESEGRLFMQGHDETIGHLVLTNPALAIATVPAVMDTEAATLTVLGNVTSWNFSPGTEEPAIKGRLSLPAGNHTFDIGGSHFYGLDIQAEITGAGGFTKTGDAALLLRTNNTFTGAVSVNNGIVEARHAQAFGATVGGVTLADGLIRLNNVRINAETLRVRGTRSITAHTDGSLLSALGLDAGWMGRIELDTNLVVISDELCILGGPIVGPGGFEFLGRQSHIFGSGVSTQPSTYTGPVRVLCELLSVREDRAFRGPLIVGGGFGPQCEVRWQGPSNQGVPEVTVHPNGLVNLNGHRETFTRLEMHGGRVSTGTGVVSVARITTHPTNVTATLAGTILLGSTPFTAFVVGDGPASPDLAVDAVITDGLNQTSVHKQGNGELLLAGANAYDGETQIQAGLVHVRHSSALGSATVGTTVFEGATLRIESVPALAEPLTIRGSGRADVGAVLDLLAATGVQAGVVLAGASTVRVDSQFAILSGVISGIGPFTKIGAGSLQFGGGSGAPNTYTGDTFVEAGILMPAKGNGVATIPGHLVIGGGGGLFGASAVVRHSAGFTIGGSVTVNRGGLWDLNGFSESFDVTALQGRLPLTLNNGGDVQTGAGTLELPAGDVMVNPGSFPGANSFLSGNLVLQPGSHRFIVQSGVSVIGLDVIELDVSAVVREQPLGAADIVKEGFGVMRLDAANSFTGPVNVNEGGLTAANALALGTAAGGTFVNGNASLAVEGRIEIVEPLTLNSTNAAALVSLGPVTNVWSGNILLQRTAGIQVSDPIGGLTHFGGVGQFDHSAISGPGGFTKSGPGVLFITGFQAGNSYTGPTTVADGSLEALRRSSLSDDIVVTGPNATLRTGRATGLSPARTVLPVGARMTVQEGALWAMNGTNFETLSRLVGDGRLQVSTGGSLTISNAVSCEFSGQVSGSGALNKSGPATFQVTGNSPGYTGAATVFDGTYKVDAQFLNSPVTVKGGSILRGNGAVGDVVVENGGVVRVDPRPGELGGEFVMNSANFQNGGVLNLGFYGSHPTGGDDHLFVNNAVTLTSPTLSAGFNYPPRDGDVITLVNKGAPGAVSGALGGFPEGALRMMGDIPVVVTYVGGNGNDVTLTVTNLPLRGGGAQLVSGNGGSALVPNDCSQLWLVVTNHGAVALTGLHGTLRSLTEGVLVTKGESAFPNLTANARGTNATPFQIRTEPTFPCGGAVMLELTLVGSNLPTMAIPYAFSGGAGTALSFDGVDDGVDLGNIPVLDFSADASFSIEAWINYAGPSDAANDGQVIVALNNNCGNTMQLLQVANGGVDAGKVIFQVRDGAGKSGLVQTATPISSNVFHHVAAVRDASSGPRTLRLYIDGVPAGTVPDPTTGFLAINAPDLIGRRNLCGTRNVFNGRIDEVRIWNAALASAQIQTNRNRGLTGGEPNLLTYYRCDDGPGSVLADGAPLAGPNNGTLLNGTRFVLSDLVPFRVPGGPDCNSGGGACESCIIVRGQFSTNTLESIRQLTAASGPSVCDPPKPCPGFDEFPDAPVRHAVHHFTNSTAAELCLTAQLRLSCPSLPNGAFGLAAYAGEYRINQPCSNYLGDDGAADSVPPPFSFRVPPQTNFLLVVTARTTNVLCDGYTLELFGLPCPPPRLDIAKDTNKILLSWSTAYPDYRLQSLNSFDGSAPFSFVNATSPPALVSGKFVFTNVISPPTRYFRLAK